MSENLTVEVILAVVAASSGTLAIVGIVAFAILFCQKQRKKQRRGQLVDKRESSHAPVRQHIDIEVLPADTTSVLSGDESVPTFLAGRPKLRQVDDDNDDDDEEEDESSQSYFGDNDDSWSYAMVRRTLWNIL